MRGEYVKITKKVLAKLDKAYAVGAVEEDGKVHLIAATEGFGECLMFSQA